jgi:hypothetical protein
VQTISASINARGNCCLPEIDYEAPLDDAASGWVRVRLTTLRGRLVIFTVQYEMTIAGERVPVVCYDNAHGFPDRDELEIRGHIRRKIVKTGDPDPRTALAIGRHDILDNWRRYRSAFRGEDV